jgi:septum site-determining protein MinD
MARHTVYSIASGKGGVGKTTTTVNLGTALAQAGNRVVIVDVDLGMANLAGYVSLDPESNVTLHEVLAGTAPIQKATYKLADNIFAVPSATALERYSATETERLDAAVEALEGPFDVVMLDVGAGVNYESVLPLGLADRVLLVTTPQPASIQDTKKTLELVEQAGGEVMGVVVTRTRNDDPVSAEAVAEEIGVTLLGAVPEDGAIRESVREGRPVVVHSPNSLSAQAYGRVAELMTEDDE